jgi:hypothetical protein
LPCNAASASERIIPLKRTGGISRKSWNLINTALLTGNTPFTKRLKSNSVLGKKAVVLIFLGQ